MNTIVRKPISSSPYAGHRMPEPSFDTKQLLSLGQQENWRFRVLGRAPMPKEPVRLGDWLLAPVQIDSSPIPARSLARIQAIFAAGIQPQGFVLVHEAPKLLPSPVVMDERLQKHSALVSPEQSALRWIGAAAGVFTIAIAAVLGFVMVALATMALASIILLPAVLVMGAVVLDPILVIVTSDNYFIEIDRW